MSVGYIHVNFVAVMLYLSCVRWYQLVKGKEDLCVIFFNCTQIYNNLRIISLKQEFNFSNRVNPVFAEFSYVIEIYVIYIKFFVGIVYNPSFFFPVF